jgi:hypothetical protein
VSTQRQKAEGRRQKSEGRRAIKGARLEFSGVVAKERTGFDLALWTDAIGEPLAAPAVRANSGVIAFACSAVAPGGLIPRHAGAGLTAR